MLRYASVEDWLVLSMRKEHSHVQNEHCSTNKGATGYSFGQSRGAAKDE
jgi:hypothetical protein